MSTGRQANGIAAGDSPFGEERLAEIAGAIADQYALHYEEKPADPRAHMAGNMLYVAFQGGLSVADRKHLEGERRDELRAFRECFFEVIANDLKSVVEGLSGSHVNFFSSAFDPESRTTNILFVLDLLPDDRVEQRQAIRNWSEQVRRNARELRTNHLQTRETHVALRDQLQDMRLERAQTVVKTDGKRDGTANGKDAARSERR
jgi:hypothetical protein